MKKILPFLLGLGLVTASQAGWLNPSQPGFVIQTFTSYQPISGNNSGTIATNGNSYQFAGDNTGAMYLGGPGVQFRGKNDGSVYVDGDGSFVLGSFGTLAMVTNRGKGSLILGNLSVGQKALITDVGNASLLLGAGTVSNSQAIVVGDGNESHGSRSVTAGSFWAMGSGFFGNGGGLTNVPETVWNGVSNLVLAGAAAGATYTGTVTAVARDGATFTPDGSGLIQLGTTTDTNAWHRSDTGAWATNGSIRWTPTVSVGGGYANAAAAVNWTPQRVPTKADIVEVLSTAAYAPSGSVYCAALSWVSGSLPAALTVYGDVYCKAFGVAHNGKYYGRFVYDHSIGAMFSPDFQVYGDMVFLQGGIVAGPSPGTSIFGNAYLSETAWADWNAAPAARANTAFRRVAGYVVRQATGQAYYGGTNGLLACDPSNRIVAASTFLPTSSNACDLGTAVMPFRDLYASGSVYLSALKVFSLSNGEVAVSLPLVLTPSTNGLGAVTRDEMAAFSASSWTNRVQIEIGTNANGTSYGIAIGPYADATNTGVAVGYAAKANDGGISMGFCATGTFESVAMSTYAHATQSGVAIGRNATGDVSGVALGSSANASTFGTALGWHTHGATQGVAIGAFAAAEPYGVAVGVSSDAGTYGTAVGRGAQAVGTGNVAVGMSAHAYPVGSNWTDSAEIGAGTNMLQGGLSFRSHALMDSNGVIVATGPWVVSGGSGTVARLQITGTPGSNSTDAARMSDVSAAASNVVGYVDGRFAAGVDGYGHFAVVGGTQLVFVAGSVTNVLDGDITQP